VINRLNGMRVALISVFVLALAAMGLCTDPTPAFDWSTDIAGIKTVVTDTVGANISAILAILGLFVCFALVWKFLRKAGARTR